MGPSILMFMGVVLFFGFGSLILKKLKTKIKIKKEYGLRIKLIHILMDSILKDVALQNPTSSNLKLTIVRTYHQNINSAEGKEGE